jgi:hypothetical protein
MPLWLSVILVSIILVLAAVAAYLHILIFKRKMREDALREEGERALLKKQQEALKSVQVIAAAYLNGDCELAEASVRIHHLLGYIDTERSQFTVFDQVADRIAHIPILDEWKALDRKTKNAHRRTISAVEEEFEAFAKDAAAKLKALEVA